MTVDATMDATGIRSAVYHFSEDPTLRRFAPHRPTSNPSHPPAVWAIDGDHAPLCWFPRDCPRISVWADTPDRQDLLTAVFQTEATRICATEIDWLPGIRDTVLYRYTFDPDDFEPWADADGQYVCDHVVRPIAVEPLDDLLALHVAAGVELRFTPRLGELMQRMLASGLPFSSVRIRNAAV